MVSKRTISKKNFCWLIRHNTCRVDDANALRPRRSMLTSERLQPMVVGLRIKPRCQHFVGWPMS